MRPELLIVETYRTYAKCAANAHLRDGQSAASSNTWLTIANVGSSISVLALGYLLTPLGQLDGWPRLITQFGIPLAAMLVTVSSVCQAVLKLESKSIQSFRAAAEYESLARKFSQTLIECPDKEVLTDLRKRLDNLTRLSPSLSHAASKAKELDVYKDQISALENRLIQEADGVDANANGSADNVAKLTSLPPLDEKSLGHLANS